MRDLEDARIVAALATSQAKLATTQQTLTALQDNLPKPPHDLTPLHDALKRALAQPLASGAVRLSQREGHVIIQLEQAALFVDARDALRPEGRALVLRCWRASVSSGVTRAGVIAAPPHPGDDATLAMARARAVASVATQQTALSATLLASARLRDPSPARAATTPTLELWLSDAPEPQASPS